MQIILPAMKITGVSDHFSSGIFNAAPLHFFEKGTTVELMVTTSGVTMGSKMIQKFTWIITLGSGKRFTGYPFAFNTQKINLALNRGSVSITVFKAVMPMMTSITMDNKASKHQGCHHAMTSAHKSIGNLMPMLDRKTHIALVVHQVCNT